MARPVYITVSSLANSNVVPLDTCRDPFNIGIACVLSAGASLTYTVQYTYDDVQAPTYNPASAWPGAF